MKQKFNDPDVFTQLEDQAIDGTLDYSNYPPAEYKYFSKLSKLGYLNRHKGWSAEVCEAKQAEIKADYLNDIGKAESVLRRIKAQNEMNIRCGQAITAIYKAESLPELYDNALEAIELLTGEGGFKDRVKRKIREMMT